MATLSVHNVASLLLPSYRTKCAAWGDHLLRSQLSTGATYLSVDVIQEATLAFSGCYMIVLRCTATPLHCSSHFSRQDGTDFGYEPGPLRGRDERLNVHTSSLGSLEAISMALPEDTRTTSSINFRFKTSGMKPAPIPGKRGPAAVWRLARRARKMGALVGLCSRSFQLIHGRLEMGVMNAAWRAQCH